MYLAFSSQHFDICSRLGLRKSNKHSKQTIAPIDYANYSEVGSIHLTIIFKAKWRLWF